MPEEDLKIRAWAFQWLAWHKLLVQFKAMSSLLDTGLVRKNEKMESDKSLI